VFALGIGSAGFAQNRGPEPTDLAVGAVVLSAGDRAELFLDHFDVVAHGTFSDIPGVESSAVPKQVERLDADAAELLIPKDVAITFNIRRLYKGAPPSGSTIKVELTSDMLLFPGSDVSRYARRLEFWLEIAAEREATAEQLARLDQSYQDGEISPDEYQREGKRLSEVDPERLAISVRVPTRMVFVSHGETFYDRGGAIQPGESYLVGLTWTPHDIRTYSLEETPQNGRNIFWGQMADDLIAALDDLALVAQ
jgi:hypothetical protein